MIIKRPCEYCHKTTDITSEIDLGPSGKIVVRACGHSYTEAPLDTPKDLHASTTPADTTSTSNNGDNPQITVTVEEAKSLFEKLQEEVPSHCEKHGMMCIKTFESLSGKHLIPFQRDGIVAAYKNNAKFIFADEMGLGKTIQALVTILLNMDKLLPGLFVCKSIAKSNMLFEVMDILRIPAQVMDKGSQTPWEQFQMHIISYDMMNRLDKMFQFSNMKPQVECPECKFRCDEGKHDHCPECYRTKVATGDTKQTERIAEDGKIIIDYSTRVVKERGKIVELRPWFDKSLGEGSTLKAQNKLAWTKIIQRCKTIILDEIHLLKNPESQRSKALKTVSSMIPHKLCLSGTLMKNNATEYFVPLNIVKPEKYWRHQAFNSANVRYELVRSVTGKLVYKYTGLLYPESFLRNNSDIMIRRTTDEVMPQLPKLWKQHKYVELEDDFKKIYDESVEEFAEWFDNATDMELRQNILGQLAKLRHQTSLAKVSFTIDLTLEHILQNDRKIAIFTHHIDSREYLAEKMIAFFKETGHDQEGPVVRVLTQGSADVQAEIDEFKNSPTEKVLILSTLAHGESLNLQFMFDCILHERQWNPANENQAISGRFRRIGQTSSKIICQIPVAIGTVDEYMLEMDERKDVIGKEIDTGERGNFNTNYVIELAEKIAEKGRKKWRL